MPGRWHGWGQRSVMLSSKEFFRCKSNLTGALGFEGNSLKPCGSSLVETIQG